MRAHAWYVHWRNQFAPIRWRWTRVILALHGSAVVLSLATPLIRFIPNELLSAPISSGGTGLPIRWGDVTAGAAVLGPFVIITPSALLFAFKYLRWQKRARSLQGRMCGNCLHDLRGLGDAGTCPECGHPFSLDQLRRYWKGVEIPPTP